MTGWMIPKQNGESVEFRKSATHINGCPAARSHAYRYSTGTVRTVILQVQGYAYEYIPPRKYQQDTIDTCTRTVAVLYYVRNRLRCPLAIATNIQSELRCYQDITCIILVLVSTVLIRYRKYYSHRLKQGLQTVFPSFLDFFRSFKSYKSAAVKVRTQYSLYVRIYRYIRRGNLTCKVLLRVRYMLYRKYEFEVLPVPTVLYDVLLQEYICTICTICVHICQQDI